MSEQRDSSGLALGVMAFTIWGLVPIYFKALDHVPPLEVLGHRVFWSVFLLMVLLKMTGKMAELKTIFSSLKLSGALTVSAILVATNWLIFIWGVTNDRILETSLGYYINPLLNVLLGYLILNEKLTPLKLMAVMLAALAVLYQILMLGIVPWVAFALALSFGMYGLVRKTTQVSAVPGLAFETLILLPVTLGYFFWLYKTGDHSFRFSDSRTSLLLALAGLVTTVPLVLFNMAAKKLTLTTIGILQYLGPSISFLVGLFIYKEEVTQAQLITFGLIWFALAIFTFDGMRKKPIPKTNKQTSPATQTAE
ncbi:EamA family transporter RarD [Endozoicomonas arenosclerae]|uniref:EamA family transporter RarD n=1 Tax=Endozoicomonas arenosclerae TaxID=1633495 RepID=UPI000AABE496|nr:EamA family transporter RarD [Endozoicomonas arenosclerae]